MLCKRTQHVFRLTLRSYVVSFSLCNPFAMLKQLNAASAQVDTDEIEHGPEEATEHVAKYCPIECPSLQCTIRMLSLLHTNVTWHADRNTIGPGSTVVGN